MENNLKRYIELADRITANPDERQKYTGFYGLMDNIKNTIPNVITANQKAIDSDKGLRLNVCRYYMCHNGIGDHTYRLQMEFIKKHYSDIQAWERETGDKLKERQSKLEKYTETDWLPESVVEIKTERQPNCINSVTKVTKEPHPDQLYCRCGANYYRQWVEQKNSPYFRLFWQIWQQGNSANFETICKMVCLYIALKNEADFIADELRLIGQFPQPQQPNEPTTDNIKVLPIDFDISDIALSKYLDNVFGVITPDEYMATTPDGRYYTAYNIKENSPFENKSQCLYKLCKIRQLTRELKQTPDPLKREELKNEREKLYAEYCNIIKPTTTQPTTAIPQPTPTASNKLLGNPEIIKALNNGVNEGYWVYVGDNHYQVTDKNLPRLAIFADMLNEREFTTIKFADIEQLFNTKNLSQKHYRVRGQNNYYILKAEVEALFS